MRVSVKSKKKKSAKLKISFQGMASVLMLLILFVLVLGVLIKNESKNITHPKKITQKIFYSKYQIKNIKANNLYKKPTPSPVVTATPVPLTGFCLHVPVLMYHHIQPEDVARQLGQTALTVDAAIFETQMQYLSANGYTTLFANELTNALINHIQLPEKSVVITMDDGYEDNYIYALPALQKYGIKANIALATGLMGNSNMLSWDEVRNLKSSGLIYFTNHTWSHYAVTRPPQEKIETEIDTAQKQIQDNTGQVANLFIYPYGSFNNNAIQTLEKKGYQGAFSEISGQYQCDSFMMTLHRTRIGNGPLSGYGI